MSIMFDNTHKKIDVSKINKNRRKLNVSVGSILLSLTLLSGCGKADKLNNNEVDNIETSQSITYVEEETDAVDLEESTEKIEIVEHDLNEKLKLPDGFNMIEMNDGSYYHENEISYADLKRVSSLMITATRDTDYSLLNYMTSLKGLSIYEKDNNCKITGVDGSRFNNLEVDFNFFGASGEYSFNEEKYSFLKDVDNISELKIGRRNISYDLSDSFLDKLNIDTLYVSIGPGTNIQDLDLKNVKNLYIVGYPYDIAMYVSKDDILKIENKGINLSFISDVDDGKDIRNEVIELSDRIDSIYNGLGINEKDDSMEKLDSILEYVLNEYDYDPEVKSNNERGIVDYDLTNSFYEEGELYAALERDTQICGNYAAMTRALCKRAGLDCYYLSSLDHAWNAIEIGDYYYYVDSTWLDGNTIHFENHVIDKSNSVETITYETKKAEDLFREDNDEFKAKLKWYLEDPTDYPEMKYNSSHNLVIEPVGLELVDVPDDVRNIELGIMVEESTTEATTEEQTTTTTINTSEDVSNKKFKVTFNGKTYIIGAAALFGILSAVGIGSLVHKEKKRKEEIRRRRRELYDDTKWDSFSWDDDFNSHKYH